MILRSEDKPRRQFVGAGGEQDRGETVGNAAEGLDRFDRRAVGPVLGAGSTLRRGGVDEDGWGGKGNGENEKRSEHGGSIVAQAIPSSPVAARAGIAAVERDFAPPPLRFGAIRLSQPRPCSRRRRPCQGKT